jgi:glycosyltransferase involved in cell wall biosynthesis
MSLPRITIVTPSFNQGRYLEQTIRSVLDQGYPNLEYIVCDGGSNDESVDIIKKYADRLAWWCSEKDRGQSHAINKGLERATGEIYAYINSDDYFMPGALERIAAEYRAGGQFMVGWSQYLEPDGDFRPYPVKPHNVLAEWLVTNPIPQQSSFWTAALWKQLGPFREALHYSFDYEYWLRVRFKAGVRPHAVNQCLAVFRLHGASKTMSGATPFDREDELLRREYGAYLSRSDRQHVRYMVRRQRARANRRAGWDALQQKNVAEARKRAWATLSSATTSLESWRLMFCALRGH